MQKEEFEHLFNSYAKSVRAFIWRRSNGLDVGVSSVDDIEADVWTIAWARKDAAPTELELELPWLFQIARHVLANHIRKNVTRRKISNTLNPDELTSLAADALVLLNEEIVGVFSVLNASEREVMALTVWEGLKPAQISVVLGVTPNAVSIRMNKARKKISEYLERNQ
jgi:RNA polymerase sigma-70 factor (ECF subfamily)